MQWERLLISRRGGNRLFFFFLKYSLWEELGRNEAGCYVGNRKQEPHYIGWFSEHSEEVAWQLQLKDEKHQS